MKRVLFFLIFACAGCIDDTSVQRDYVGHRNACHARAEDRFEVYHPDSSAMSDKEKNNALLALFSECMKEHDWKVAGPAKDKDKEKAPAAKPEVAAAPYTLPPGYALVPVVPMQMVPVTPPAVTALDAATARGAPAHAAAQTATQAPKARPNSAATPIPADKQGKAELERIIDKE